jgi:hypothetical protein
MPSPTWLTSQRAICSVSSRMTTMTDFDRRLRTASNEIHQSLFFISFFECGRPRLKLWFC